ncbi:MAG: hypothetical protein IPJ46_04105 [Anaerolineales bacterium]|nr:hypothetical protein [Anaerolineales bacterium]
MDKLLCNEKLKKRQTLHAATVLITKFKIKTVLQNLPNKACTGRWGFCGIFEHFSGFEFSLLPSRVHARPSASNANRWAFSVKLSDTTEINEQRKQFVFKESK